MVLARSALPSATMNFAKFTIRMASASSTWAERLPTSWDIKRPIGWNAPSARPRSRQKNWFDQLEMKPGEVVADIGAGTGYLSRRLGPTGRRQGKVLAVDIQPEMLDLLTNKMVAFGITNVDARVGTAIRSQAARPVRWIWCCWWTSTTSSSSRMK